MLSMVMHRNLFSVSFLLNTSLNIVFSNQSRRLTSAYFQLSSSAVLWKKARSSEVSWVDCKYCWRNSLDWWNTRNNNDPYIREGMDLPHNAFLFAKFNFMHCINAISFHSLRFVSRQNGTLRNNLFIHDYTYHGCKVSVTKCQKS